jgi:hypothetical protein
VDLRIALTGLTAILAFLFFLAVLDQWRTRRHGFQLAWALGCCGSRSRPARGDRRHRGWNEPIC